MSFLRPKDEMQKSIPFQIEYNFEKAYTDFRKTHSQVTELLFKKWDGLLHFIFRAQEAHSFLPWSQFCRRLTRNSSTCSRFSRLVSACNTNEANSRVPILCRAFLPVFHNGNKRTLCAVNLLQPNNITTKLNTCLKTPDVQETGQSTCILPHIARKQDLCIIICPQIRVRMSDGLIA